MTRERLDSTQHILFYFTPDSFLETSSGVKYKEAADHGGFVGQNHDEITLFVEVFQDLKLLIGDEI